MNSKINPKVLDIKLFKERNCQSHYVCIHSPDCDWSWSQLWHVETVKHNVRICFFMIAWINASDDYIPTRQLCSSNSVLLEKGSSRTVIARRALVKPHRQFGTVCHTTPIVLQPSFSSGHPSDLTLTDLLFKINHATVPLPRLISHTVTYWSVSYNF
jgi:hypothetical protein